MRSALVYALAVNSLVIITARADETIPTIDSTAYCTITAELVDDDAFKQQCLDSETRAERHIRALWAEAPGRVRAVCVKQTQLEPSSYQGLSTCMSTLVGDMWIAGELKIVLR